MSDANQAPGASADLRQELKARMQSARTQTDQLFRVVLPEALYDRPIPERHRIIFYLGHFEAFEWNLIARQVLGLPSFHPTFDKLFAFGIDPVGGDLPDDQPSEWPARDEIIQYNTRIRQTLDEALTRATLTDPNSPLLHHGFIFHVAIEHRLMHAETLAYMLHQLPLERKLAMSAPAPPLEGAVVPRMALIPAGQTTLGRPRTPGYDFGWDNEYEAHTVSVPEFAIDAYNVTNRHFIDFMLSGGYDKRDLWDEQGWEWKTKKGIYHPHFWIRRHDAWFQRNMFGEVSLPLDWPVYVSHAEASAFVRWAGKGLPSEMQFHRAAYGTPDGSEREFPWGNEPPGARHGNFDFQRWDPASVSAYPDGASAFGVHGLLGNGWEWTSTPFAPFEGFQAFPFYPGYSADFFDGKHFVLKGGSARTAACLLRRSFRNWFQPHYPYLYATFRGVVNR